MNRRDFIKITTISAAGVLLPIKYVQANDKEILNPTLITPNKDFFALHIGEIPSIDLKSWKLAITGHTERMTILTYNDILKMKAITKMYTLTCIGDVVDGNQIGNAKWTGVLMREVLNKAGVKKDVKKVILRGADGYNTSIPIKDALDGDALLAYKMNGETLPTEHGYPLRFLCPKHYGTKNPKWLVNIELTPNDHKGYWEKQGWDDEALVKIKSGIGRPENKEIIESKEYIISGYAFDGGNHGGIAKVEVSTDDGKTWNEAEIWATDSPLAWSLWKYTWQVPSNNERLFIKARAIAKDNTIQGEVTADGTLSGSSGLHTVGVTVK
jgi:DMSO/TMAO reductase YedYZ molybdopterin-dependent catalytic subunit